MKESIFFDPAKAECEKKLAEEKKKRTMVFLHEISRHKVFVKYLDEMGIKQVDQIEKFIEFRVQQMLEEHQYGVGVGLPSLEGRYSIPNNTEFLKIPIDYKPSDEVVRQLLKRM